jgi:hypothetical protein
MLVRLGTQVQALLRLRTKGKQLRSAIRPYADRPEQLIQEQERGLS